MSAEELRAAADDLIRRRRPPARRRARTPTRSVPSARPADPLAAGPVAGGPATDLRGRAPCTFQPSAPVAHDAEPAPASSFERQIVIAVNFDLNSYRAGRPATSRPALRAQRPRRRFGPPRLRCQPIDHARRRRGGLGGPQDASRSDAPLGLRPVAAVRPHGLARPAQPRGEGRRIAVDFAWGAEAGGGFKRPGWGTWIRTKAFRVRVGSSTAKLSPNAARTEAFACAGALSRDAASGNMRVAGREITASLSVGRRRQSWFVDHQGRLAIHLAAQPSGPVRARGGQLFAALDLGTNNCRLLVGAPLTEGFRVLDSFSRTVRLGEGLHDTGRLSPAARRDVPHEVNRRDRRSPSNRSSRAM